MEVEFTKRWEQGAGGLVGGTEDVEGCQSGQEFNGNCRSTERCRDGYTREQGGGLAYGVCQVLLESERNDQPHPHPSLQIQSNLKIIFKSQTDTKGQIFPHIS